jgi:hypothetical protein
MSIDTRLVELQGQNFQDSDIVEKNVTALYAFRAKLWGATPEEYQYIAEEHGIEANGHNRKEIFNLYLGKNFPQSKDVAEHQRKLDMHVHRLQEHFVNHGSQMALSSFGSWATGRITNIYSDNDILGVLSNDVRDIEAIETLEEAGFIVSKDLSNIEGLYQLQQTGRGLVRIYAMSKDGIETEFHILGERDAMDMHKINPGSINRVIPVGEKQEMLFSFNGTKKSLLKPGDRVPNYVKHDGTVFRGFFPEAVLFSVDIFDPKGVSEAIRRDVYKANVKAYLYHNNLYKKTELGFEIILDGVSFKDFLSTCYPAQGKAFPPERYQEYEEYFYEALQSINTQLKRIPD